MSLKEELLKRLSDGVVEMEEDDVEEAAKEYLEAGYPAFDGIMEGLVDGMNRASQLYEEEEYFVTDVLLCSDAMYVGLDVSAYAIESVEDYGKLPRIDTGKGRAKVVLDAIRILREETDGVPIIGNLTGPISTASSVMEPVVFYKELRKKNKQAHAYMDFITRQLISFGRAQIEAGADVIAISDPSGTGEILGPKYFEEFAVTYLNQLLDGLQEEKMGTIVHICGQMSPVYKEVNMVRSSVLSFDSVVPMKEARANLKDRVLMGNVSTFALEFGEQEKVRTLAKGCVKSGSDIISPACGLGMKSPLANVQAILKCLKEDL